MEDSMSSNASKFRVQSFIPNNRSRALSLVLFVLFLVAVGFSGVLFAKNRRLNKGIEDIKLSQKYEWGVNLFSWVEGDRLEPHYLSPSLLTTLKNDSFKRFTCLDFGGGLSLDTLRKSIGNESLITGLERIEDYEFTTPLVDANQDPLPPVKAKYEIDYNNICKISEGKYVVLFLTTQKRKEGSSLLPSVGAAGGWLGDSHMALIEGSNLKIYERFPFVADLIDIPKEGEDELILRFGEYYSCGEVVASTGEHIVIECPWNIYSYEYQNESFKELAVCGSRIENGSYMTTRYTCLDVSGTPYLDY